jgi:glycosyltransferase involved in cell wall biosynthesis
MTHLSARLELTNTIFTGATSEQEAARLLSRARYVVVPSLVQETFSLVALEAMAAGKPVIGSRVGALPELVGEQRGILCSPGDLGELSTTILQLKEDSDLCERLGARARIYVEEQLNPGKHLAGLEAAYEQAIAS